MKQNYVKIAFSAFILAFVCFVGRYVLCYCSGYYGKPKSLYFFLMIIGLLQLIILFLLTITCATSLIAKSYRLLMIVMLVSFLTLNWISHTLVTPGGAIIHGLKNQIIKNYNLNDIRQLANDFNQLPRLTNYDFPTTDKIYRNQDLIRVGLSEKYPFLNYLDRPTIIEKTNVLYIKGGRPLRGICIAVDGQKIIAEKNLKSQSFQASDDVVFTVESD